MKLSDEERAILHTLAVICRVLMEETDQKDKLAKTIEEIYNDVLTDHPSAEYEEVAQRLFHYFFGKEYVRRDG